MLLQLFLSLAHCYRRFSDYIFLYFTLDRIGHRYTLCLTHITLGLSSFGLLYAVYVITVNVLNRFLLSEITCLHFTVLHSWLNLKVRLTILYICSIRSGFHSQISNFNHSLVWSQSMLSDILCLHHFPLFRSQSNQKILN